MEDLTEWFNGNAKPARDEVYIRDYGFTGSSKPTYCKFSKGFWYQDWNDAIKAAKECKLSDWQNDPWRDLSKEPGRAEHA